MRPLYPIFALPGLGYTAGFLPLIDVYLALRVGDHSVADDVDRLNIPPIPGDMPNKLLRLHIEGCEEESILYPHRDVEDPVA